MQPMPTTPVFRYEQLVAWTDRLIDRGLWPPGTRMPSVRALSSQHKVSVSTVLQAYRTLETRGRIEARPRSARVAIGHTVLALLEHTANPALVPLGCTVPDASLLPTVPLDRALTRAARLHGVRANTYGSAQGEVALRQEIARRAIRTGQALSADEVVITSGCTEAITLALSAVTRPGDIIAVESPTYFGQLHTLEVLGLKALELPTDPVRGIDVDALDKRLQTDSIAACLLSSSFNNPMGGTMRDADKRRLLALLARHRLPLIEDDVYGDIHFGRDRPTPFMALDGADNTIYCSSFSKSLAPGYRIGWIVAGRHTQRVMERRLAYSLCSPILPQLALADFLSAGHYERHLRSLRRTLEHQLLQMTQAVEASFPPATRVSRPQGGFALWVELPRGFDSHALIDQALDAGVCFVPGDVFSASRQFRHCLRLSAASRWTPAMAAGVQKLGRLATQMLV